MSRVIACSIWIILVTLAPARAEQTFVLVHGAWVGEWYWDPIAAGLRDRGHSVYAVTLRGHGRAADENGPQVTLDDHIQDIVTLIEKHDLKGITLVAHSYGGRPATGAWDRMRHRIQRVVFVEAFLPRQSNAIAFDADNRALAFLVIKYPEIVDKGQLPVPVALRSSSRGIATPQSLNTLYGELKLVRGPLPDTPRTYVVAKESGAGMFREFALLAARDGWQVQEIGGGHDIAGDGSSDLIRLLDALD